MKKTLAAVIIAGLTGLTELCPANTIQSRLVVQGQTNPEYSYRLGEESRKNGKYKADFGRFKYTYKH